MMKDTWVTVELNVPQVSSVSVLVKGNIQHRYKITPQLSHWIKDFGRYNFQNMICVLCGH